MGMEMFSYLFHCMLAVNIGKKPFIKNPTSYGMNRNLSSGTSISNRSPLPYTPFSRIRMRVKPGSSFIRKRLRIWTMIENSR